MAGRLGHIVRDRRVGHVPRNGIRPTNYLYGFTQPYFHLNAAIGLDTNTNLGAVGSWTDQINNIEWTQGTAGNKPRLVLSDARYNNLPVVQFQDNARRMNSIYGFSFPQNATVAFIANYDTINTNNAVMGALSISLSQRFILGGTATGANGPAIINDSGTYFSGTTEDTGVKICVMTYSNIMVNGVVEWSGTVTPSLSPLFVLGGFRTLTTNGLIGSLAEFIAYNQQLSTTDMLILSDNINSKYAIY
jgi:hypothetical protein